MITRRIHISGTVQGVGFRPFVYGLAHRLGLTGWVLNASDGVTCLVQGREGDVARFVGALRDEAPPMAVVASIDTEAIEHAPIDTFEIRPSLAREDALTFVSPDIATCDACISELSDERDRRFRYPFINCTNCGPRFTIIDDIPYDRPRTSMSGFKMCDACTAEYTDPGNRRFHAQPDACFACGPRLYLHAPGTPQSWRLDTSSGPRSTGRADVASERTRSDAIIAAAAALIREGRILALKGLGGFHLACDATDSDAVARLRARKHRWAKPLALMVRDVAEAQLLAEVSTAERALLEGPARPIVLLKRERRHPPPGATNVTGADSIGPDQPLKIADEVVGGLPDVGIMLPYTPVHQLLVEAVGRPLVMTSGNLTDEPIAIGDSEAIARLGPIADGILLHDRAIRSRYDDSVVRVVLDTVHVLRRARGHAPSPIAVPRATNSAILAVGPEQKNTFTLLAHGHAFVSQHIGEMESAEALDHFHDTLSLYQRLFRIKPQIVAHDMHPEYLATKFAQRLGLPMVGVQHHHAHIASVAAEHGIRDPVIGVAFDGTGFGTDGRIWGGEVLLSTWERFFRIAHLKEVPMPGGAAAIRRPARMALGTLLGLNAQLVDHPGARRMLDRLAEGEASTVARMIERSVNSPLTSSMGRLFDTVSALMGIRLDARYEGEAAVELEAVIDPRAQGSYEFGLDDGDPILIDPLPVIESVLADIARGVPDETISARFHRAVVACIVSTTAAATERTGVRTVALAGGVFLNRFVLQEALSALGRAGVVALTNERLPVSDGSISFGQAAIASASWSATASSGV